MTALKVVICPTTGIGSRVLNEVLRVWRCRGSKCIPLPQCLHLQSILNDQGRTLLAHLLETCLCQSRQMKPIFQESSCAEDDILDCCCARKFKTALINGTSSDIMILYSVASPPLTLPTYPFSQHVMCIAGCVVRRHREATLST